MDIHPSRLSLGTKVCLITGAQYRYEGVVAAINSIEGTLTLQNVRFWGTENRASNNAVSPSENKAPAVGSVFDSITFWMSSIVQLWPAEVTGVERNDLGDKGIVKTGIPIDTTRGRGPRRPMNWWSPDDSRPSVRASHSRGSDTMPMNNRRYPHQPVEPMMSNQSRMLVSYPRRRGNGGMIPRQASYVPVVPVLSGQNGPRRSGYGAPMNRGGPAYRIMNTPVQNGNSMGVMNGPNGSANAIVNMGSGMQGQRMGGRKPMPPSMRRVNGAGDERRYGSQNGMGAPGGLFVYLPPEMAAAYQSHGINLVPARSGLPRRRMIERRGTPRGLSSTEPEVDCTTPYDFETANAELEAELAKISLNSDDVPTQEIRTGDPSGIVSSDPNVDIQENEHRPCSSPSVVGTLTAAAGPSGNGASGDSSLGVVTVSVPETVTNIDGNWPLAKGEYYVRDKCFFDQISRSEGILRTSYPGNMNNRGPYNHISYSIPSNLIHQPQNGPMMNNTGSGLSSAAAAARRERQLNMETFGPMAARATFVPRRRPAGVLPREYLVSAPA